MNANLRQFLILAAAAVFVVASPSARADVSWRVSVKIFLAPDGSPPRPTGETNYDTFQEVRNAFDLYNQTFDRMGWGFRLEMVDLVGIPGFISGRDWFTMPARDGTNRLELELAAKLQPATFHYRPLDAINVYINNTSSGISGGHLPLIGDVIFMGIKGGGSNLVDRFWVKTLLHETGHALGLCHTQGCDCNGCNDPLGPCNTPGDDFLADTLIDLSCWTTNDIALGNFSLPYTSLNLGQRQQVDLTFSNLMSYHRQSINFLTHDQWERMVDVSNDPLGKRHVASGWTLFVDRGNPCLRPEDLAEPFRTLAQNTPGWSWGTRNGFGVTLDPRSPPPGFPAGPCPPEPLPCSLTVCLGGPFKMVGAAVNSANAGDRLQIKAGHYNEPVTINKHLTLSTDRGLVVIGAP